ncbi:otu domain containing protein [Holotrichia oblita]|uniref:Otu domain containing protein n=1 Tax=Holotrichia oblita TaxID=644536 RepID=A0ACB9SWZ2_HOLOL|nr:otu domain containing protein [Holotrichia oblita]
MAKHTRKGKNLGPVDAWLDTLGYYRKNVAYDETCLFRAISEQLFSCQIHHERCRKEIVTYGRNNYHEFKQLVSCEEEWIDHLNKLEIHMVICGNIELEITSRKYKKDIIVFDGVNRLVNNMANNNYEEALLLCLMGEDHYDVVYRKECIQTAGFCQCKSLVYNILYEEVFNIPNVSSIVQAMLYEKPAVPNNDKQTIKQEKDNSNMNDLEYMLRTNIAPFPYKVAKALDPTIYRNIEYDTWTETRKELRLGDWYYGDNNLILGTCCELTTESGKFQCYIQDILKDQNKCVVYITSLAEKRTVNYADLSPESDAKPWPLPYRHLELPDKDKKYLRKKREKKRSGSKSGSDSGSNSIPQAPLSDQNDLCPVNVFEGCPLHMQRVKDYENETTTQTDANTQVNYSELMYSVESTWEHTPPTPDEQSIWPQTPTTPQNVFTFVPKPVMPGTPEMSYATGWTNVTDNVQGNNQSNLEPTQMDVPISPDPYSYTYYDNMYSSPVPMVANDRSVCTTPLTPISPQVEVYPTFFAPPPPVAPVIYASPEITEILLPSPHVPVYSPAIEMSYISPSPFIYPSTPPATWYPPAINSQGFIFPTPVNRSSKVEYKN